MSQIILKVGQPKIISVQVFDQKILMIFPHIMSNRYKFAEKKPEDILNYSMPLTAVQFWAHKATIIEISILVIVAILNWGKIIFKGDHTRTLSTKFGLIWLSSFREKGLNEIFYQNMPHLHNRYKSAERKISEKNPQYSSTHLEWPSQLK